MAEVAFVTLDYARNADSLAVGDFLDQEGAHWDRYKNPRAAVVAAVEVDENGAVPEYIDPQAVRGMVGVTIDTGTGNHIVEHATLAFGEPIHPDQDDMVERLGDAVAMREFEMTGIAPTAERVTGIICRIGELASVDAYKEVA